MAQMSSAGRLRERVAFDERGAASDGLGGAEAAFVERFNRAAEYIHLRGGEGVLAARLGGRHTQVVRVRADRQTRAVTTDWRLRDVRTEAAFNIRDVTATPDRKWIDLLCERGVA